MSAQSAMSKTPPIALAEKLVNIVLDTELEDERIRSSLEGQSMQIVVRGTHLAIHLALFDRRLVLHGTEGREPGVRVSGSLPTLLGLLRNRNRAENLLAGDVVVEGDLEVASRFVRLFQAVDIDWEEHLSRVVGDAGAHALTRAASSFARWQRDNARHFISNLAEYLTEESQMLADKAALENYCQEVDTLREAVDRLAARCRAIGVV